MSQSVLMAVMSDRTGMAVFFIAAAVVAFLYVVVVAREWIRFNSAWSFIWAFVTLGLGVVAVIYLRGALPA